jgi:hypothetical protein
MTQTVQKRFSSPKNCTQRGTIRVDTTVRAYFCFIESGVNPGASSGHAERPERSHDAHNSTSSSRPDCHQERLDADDVHYAREVVGEYVQRHFGRDIGQPLH